MITFQKEGSKTRNRYNDNNVTINADYISPNAYDNLFKISVKANGNYTITDEDDATLKINGQLNTPLQHNLFFLTITPNSSINEDFDLYFTFRTKEWLTDDFLSRLNVNYVSDGSSVLAVSLVSETPQRDIDFINKLAGIFLFDNLNQKNDAANKTIKFIDEQLDGVKTSLEASEGAMTQFRQSNQILDMSSHSSEILGKAASYDEKQNELRIKELYFNYLSNYLKTNLESGAIIVPVSLGLNETNINDDGATI
ncbi:MAG: hypothetical protein QM751_14370 [Paludibacteraceae bacterium]